MRGSGSRCYIHNNYDSRVLSVNQSHLEINDHNQYFPDVQSNKATEGNIFTTDNNIQATQLQESFQINDFHLFDLQWMRLSSSHLPGLRSEARQKHLLK